MKTHIYIFLLFAAISLSSCSSYKALSEKRDIERAINQEQVLEAIETQDYIIKVNKLYARRLAHLDLRPDFNYIVIRNNKARINLAYAGRSFTLRPVSGINFTGEVIEREITPKKRGNMILKMKIQDQGDTFNVVINVSNSGYCNINIYHPRLDGVSYRGLLTARL